MQSILAAFFYSLKSINMAKIKKSKWVQLEIVFPKKTIVNIKTKSNGKKEKNETGTIKRIHKGS